MRYLTFAALALGIGMWTFYMGLYITVRLFGAVTFWAPNTIATPSGWYLTPWFWVRFTEVWIEPFILAASLGVLAVAIVNLLRTWPRGLWPDRRESET